MVKAVLGKVLVIILICRFGLTRSTLVLGILVRILKLLVRVMTVAEAVEDVLEVAAAGAINVFIEVNPRATAFVKGV